MIISEDKKIEILLEALKERYMSIHTIRERVQNLSLWIIAIFLGVSGYIIENNITITYSQKIIYTAIFLLAIFIFRVFYLQNLEKGFNSQRITTANIEDSLELYKEDIYIIGKSIYPKTWRNSGMKGCEGNFFFNNYLLVYFGVVILISIIWLKGVYF